MPPLSFPVIWTVMIDIFAWAFFHIFVSVLCLKLPLSFFLKESAWFRTFVWEKSGKVWQRIFRVKSWKGRLVDGTVILKKGYEKKKLHGTSIDDLKVFAAETRRAEMTHWLSIVPAPLFFIWNPIWAGWIMILYAVMFNLPFIIVQRYNRGRIDAITLSTSR
ncbi:glycosyl-4,4'-diaponeurosporenoate acyltransferase CrtO family protein [Paenibacillus sp. WC2504]|uniref:glycosyl-4,4'-diaponeurosporenoate acyltransferase CrtO family protein n=1 Tax=Paenibacillus sp. WC2504 TaxID=3461403 RepID=UPI0040462D53